MGAFYFYSFSNLNVIFVLLYLLLKDYKHH